jgi:hypothetical protein
VSFMLIGLLTLVFLRITPLVKPLAVYVLEIIPAVQI